MYVRKEVEFKNSKGQVVGKIGPRFLEDKEAAQAILDAGFKNEDAVIALAVMKEESALSPDAEGDLLIQDAEWGPSIGAMQIRSLKDEFGEGTQRDALVLKDHVRNLKEARAIHAEQGFRPWGAYSTGRHSKHLPWARLVFSDLKGGTMTAADSLLREAAKHIGYTESPSGSNRQKFAAEAGHANGQPWCASFVVAIARRVGLRLPSESAYTPSMAEGFRAAGRFDKNPKKGDVVFFDFPDSKYRIQHVGFLESFTATTVTCIEANTSSGTSGSQDNGGGVYRRTRLRDYVVGYGHPAYTTTTPKVEDVTEEQVRKLLDEALEPVIELLELLYKADYQTVTVDGVKKVVPHIELLDQRVKDIHREVVPQEPQP